MDQTEKGTQTPPVIIAKGAEATTPAYFRDFLSRNSLGISESLGSNNVGGLSNQLRAFAEILPVDGSFKEIAALVCRQENGGLSVATVEGNIDEIDAQKAADLLDDLVERVPVNTEQVLLLHTHPSDQSPIGPVAPAKVGFSDEDRQFLKILGSKLRILDPHSVYASVVTANSKQVVIERAQSLGRAFGWEFKSPQMQA